jgi:hypothetical protein
MFSLDQGESLGTQPCILLGGGPFLLHNPLADTEHSVDLAWLERDYFLLL